MSTVSEGSDRRTPLYEAHLAAGGRMVSFAGWTLPVRYGGVIGEHRAVRSGVGVFDVSHMGEARVSGVGALDLLQFLTSNDVSKIGVGRAHYNGLLTPSGTFVDDLLIYRLDETEYLLVLNAANTAKDLAWIEEHARGYDARVTDESEMWAQIAVQGPRALATVGPLAECDAAGLRYYRFAMAEVAGARGIVSRTGYTGEDGFELYVPAAEARGVWDAVLQSGAAHGIQPAGLAARDTLRLEARMALYGNDIDDTTTVLEADLGWICKLDKGDFLGRQVLARQAENGVERRLVGFEMRGRAIARQGFAVHHEGKEVGRVTSGSFAPQLQKSIGLAYLPVELTAVGTAFQIDVRGRAEPAEVVETPFYKRPR